jgi:hypothetical protein
MIAFVTRATANRGGSIALHRKTASAVATALCRRLSQNPAFPVENPEIQGYVSFAQDNALNSAAIAAGDAKWARNSKLTCMINPTGDEFNEEVPTSASADVGAFQQRSRSAAGTASEAWEQTKEKAGEMKTRTEIFVRRNPIPILLGALGAGIAIGLAIRYASTAATKEDEPREKIGHGALGFLSLPFLLPFLKSVRTKAEDSADAIKEGVDRLKNVKVSRYAKPIRKRWKAWTK